MKTAIVKDLREDNGYVQWYVSSPVLKEDVPASDCKFLVDGVLVNVSTTGELSRQFIHISKYTMVSKPLRQLLMTFQEHQKCLGNYYHCKKEAKKLAEERPDSLWNNYKNTIFYKEMEALKISDPKLHEKLYCEQINFSDFTYSGIPAWAPEWFNGKNIIRYAEERKKNVLDSEKSKESFIKDYLEQNGYTEDLIEQLTWRKSTT